MGFLSLHNVGRLDGSSIVYYRLGHIQNLEHIFHDPPRLASINTGTVKCVKCFQVILYKKYLCLGFYDWVLIKNLPWAIHLHISLAFDLFSSKHRTCFAANYSQYTFSTAQQNTSLNLKKGKSIAFEELLYVSKNCNVK